MSGAPRGGAHEEGVHLSPSSMRPGFGGEEEEKPGFPRVNYGAVQEPRQVLLPRPESRDGERRSPLQSVYKMPSSVTDTPHSSHPVGGPEIRMEMRDAKDVRENQSVESNKDGKVETREVHHQVAKAEESRVDDSKEVIYDREGRNDSKNELKMEKDVSGAAGRYYSWKDLHRVKKHSDVQSGGSGTPNLWMSHPQVRKFDSVKHASPAFLRKETDEAIGENRVDIKGDKERKRKEGKHHDWPESDKDKSDQKSNVQIGSSSSNIDLKEVSRENKDSEQLGRERKDVLKEKERSEERQKDLVDREGGSGGEKEGYQKEKEMADKTSVQEYVGLEQKKPSESWRNMEREAKERRRDKDGDLEGERPEKRNRGYDKESNEGGADVDVAVDRDKDAFNYALQQRKRMLRPRGSPQVANRDGRFKSRNQDGEGYIPVLYITRYDSHVACYCDFLLLTGVVLVLDLDAVGILWCSRSFFLYY